jgi:type IX secretion system PorP/SprF family membrane protein
LKLLVKKLLITKWLILLSGIAISQQLPLYGQYMMNGFLINPAIAGSDGYTTTSVTIRDHWAGLQNSPKTFAASVQTRVLWKKSSVNRSSGSSSASVDKRSGRVGLGAYIFNDQNALVDRTGAQIAYAYHIFLNNTQLSFGLAASAFQFKLDQDKLTFRDSEPLLAEGFDNLIYVPDFTFGMYLLNRNTFLGISAAQLLQTKINVGSQNIDYKMNRHYYFMGGYRIPVSSNTELEPSVMTKVTETGIMQADIVLRGIYNEFYWAGISYRTQSSVGLLLGVRAKKVYFGYAFDYSFSDIRKYSYGSHELNISVKFGDSSRRYRWMRRY